jgi:hypothetical protein
VLKSLTQPVGYCCLSGLVAVTIKIRKPESFKIVEIGVFKGDNAASLIRLAQHRGAQTRYVGFDLFEDIDEFFLDHPEDRKWYDDPDSTYFEFRSGQHSFDSVTAKLSAIQPPDHFTLVPGDSTRTVSANYSLIEDADFIYIDGCHDYDVVRQDWQNVRPLIQKNPHLVIAFDDATYSGVARVRNEISSGDKEVRVLSLNYNQFFVISRSMPWIERGGLRAIDLIWRLFGKTPSLQS